MNLVILTGKVCGMPKASKTGRGTDVAEIHIEASTKHDSVLKVTAFGGLARKVTQNVTPGLHVVVFGCIDRDTRAGRDDHRIVMQEYLVGHVQALPVVPALI